MDCQELSPMTRDRQRLCISCRHFHNTPAYLENTFKGLTSLSSAHASVRKDDGICDLHEVYLSADSWCDHFVAAVSANS